jgi:DNA-binding MarR family transcriptional regulator
MTSDIPSFTDHEVRALLYIHETEMQINDSDNPPSITKLKEYTDWDSKYYTRAWKRLQPRGLVKREVDGKHTKLSLTEKGKEVASYFMSINEVLDQ